MSTDAIPSRANAQTIDQTWFNILQTVLSGDIVPRTSGAVADLGGGLGTDSLRFLKAFIASGYWDVGDIKAHFPYAGAAPIGQGWMLCDGRVVSQSAYDTEHASGDWAQFVGASPLNGLHLPDLVDGGGRFLQGASSPSGDGTGPISTFGSNSLNGDHSHTVNGHTHDLSNHTHTLPSGSAIVGSGSFSLTTGGPSNNNSGSASPGTDNGSLGTLDITPACIKVQYYMRVI